MYTYPLGFSACVFVTNSSNYYNIHNHHNYCPDLNDFNNTNITLVFEPDEGAEVSNRNAPIFITDDDINEATEQVFVAELLLINSSNPVSVDLTTRPSTLCRIIDNDRKYKEKKF